MNEDNVDGERSSVLGSKLEDTGFTALPWT